MTDERHGRPGKPKRQPKRQRVEVDFEYPKHVLQPEDLLDFIELPCFTARWDQLGLNDENDLCALQIMIMANPSGQPVIRGTGGIRKMRFAPDRWHTGASGAARVLYTHFEEFGIVLLCLVYGKGEVETISPAIRKQLRKLNAEVKRELERRKHL